MSTHAPRVECLGGPLDGVLDVGLPQAPAGGYPHAFEVGSGGYYVRVAEVRHADLSFCGVGYAWVEEGSPADLAARYLGLFDGARRQSWEREAGAWWEVESP